MDGEMEKKKEEKKRENNESMWQSSFIKLYNVLNYIIIEI